MHFFSNNNSAILRKYWNDIPFQSTDFGEDQLWANKIIENRLTIYYAEKAIVRHSHNFSFVNAIKRKSIELNYFYNNFGYKTEKTMMTFVYMLKSVISDFKWLNNNHKNIF